MSMRSVISDGNHGLVRQAADQAATVLGMERSWLSEAVSHYTSVGANSSGLAFSGLYPETGRPGLRVVVAKPEYLLAMKLAALQRQTAEDRDFEDARRLATELGIASVDDLERSYHAFFPGRTCRNALTSRAGALRVRSGRGREPAPCHTGGGRRRFDRRFRHGLRRVLRRLLSRLPRQGAHASPPRPGAAPERRPRTGRLDRGIGEHLALRWGLKFRDGLREPDISRFARPSYMPPSKALQSLLIAESPPAFRSRLIFTGAEPLERARFPRDVERIRMPWDDRARNSRLVIPKVRVSHGARPPLCLRRPLRIGAAVPQNRTEPLMSDAPRLRILLIGASGELDARSSRNSAGGTKSSRPAPNRATFASTSRTRPAS